MRRALERGGEALARHLREELAHRLRLDAAQVFEREHRLTDLRGERGVVAVERLENRRRRFAARGVEQLGGLGDAVDADERRRVRLRQFTGEGQRDVFEHLRRELRHRSDVADDGALTVRRHRAEDLGGAARLQPGEDRGDELRRFAFEEGCHGVRGGAFEARQGTGHAVLEDLARPLLAYRSGGQAPQVRQPAAGDGDGALGPLQKVTEGVVERSRGDFAHRRGHRSKLPELRFSQLANDGGCHLLVERQEKEHRFLCVRDHVGFSEQAGCRRQAFETSPPSGRDVPSQKRRTRAAVAGS